MKKLTNSEKRFNGGSFRYLSLIMAIIFIAGCFSLFPKLEANADTLPIGEGENIVFGQTYSMPKAWADYYYTLTVPSSGTINFKNAGADTIWGVEINDANGKNVAYADYIGAGSVHTYYMRKGQYAVRVWTMNHESDKFAFYFTTANETFGESETSNNDSENTASPIKALNGDIWTGVISKNDGNDWYSFSLNQKSILDIILKEKTEIMGENLDFDLYNENGDKVAESGYYLDSKYTYAIDKGNYKIRIHAGNNSGIYNFSLKATPIDTAAKLTIKSAPVVKAKKKGKLNVSWKKFAKADGYQIQVSRKKNFSGAKTISTTAESIKKTVTVKKAWRKKVVYVRVRTYKLSPTGEKIWTSWSKARKIKTK